MKTPAFWYQPPGWKSLTLTPFGFLFRLGGLARGVFAKAYRAKVPLICVGNIVAGGAGKTPTSLALAALLLREGAKPVFVARGYGGMKHGPLRVDLERHSALDVGDEALLLARTAPCWIGRDRAAAAREAEKEATHILLDDGFQNPNIAPHVGLLVIDGASGLGNEKIIPAGPLRESLRSALPRTSAVVMIGADTHELASRLAKPLLRARLVPRLPENFDTSRAFFAFAGIARPEKFYATCRAAGLKLEGTCDFPDHCVFDDRELAALADYATRRNLTLLTTSKDYVRIPLIMRGKTEVLPVELVFEDETAVLKAVLGARFNRP